jgi:hypothetical protein
MKTEIVKGWLNSEEHYRVYINWKREADFKTEEEAKAYLAKRLTQIKLEKASIADDEQN